MITYRTKSSEINLPPGRLRTVRKIDGRAAIRRVNPDIRGYVQILFLLITLWIGIEYILFVTQLGTGKPPAISRPSGVEGFLPISALISFRYFLLTGILNHIHPSGLVIFFAIIFISTFLKKGFCSWICPVGLISESLHQFGNKIFKRNFQLPKLIDIPLRSIKYLLLFFFVYNISLMTVDELRMFIYSDYNKAADLKLYLFFANIGTLSVVVIGILIFLSLLIKNFWCRYACPYGALLGILSMLSPLKVRRNDSTCIKCGKCSLACPSYLPVDKLDSVNSAECFSCYSCIEACPVPDTLNFSISSESKGISQTQYAIIITGIYFLIVGFAVMLGYWHSSISTDEYLTLFKNIGTINHVF
ncbi:MAG: 4Fe-4S binding protein [Candidatus Kryptoniota bacterium]